MDFALPAAMIATSEARLREEMRPLGIERGGELYLPPVQALEFSRRCREASLCVVGVECFERAGENVRPRLDLVADWSDVDAATWAARVRACHASTVTFLQRLPAEPPLLVTLTVLAEDEWPSA